MHKFARKLVMVALGGGLLGFVPSNASAQSVNLNVCEKLVEDLFIPPTFEELRTCKTPSNFFKKLAYCSALPGCCLPGMCLVDPICFTARQIQTAAGYWKYRGDTYCSMQDVTPRELLNKILMDQVVNAADLLTGGLYDQVRNLAEGDMDVIYARAHAIPSAWKDYLTAFIAPYYDNGANGYAYGDLDNARIISNRDGTAQWYLKDGMDGITLGNVVILSGDTYDTIMNQPISSSQHTQAQWSALATIAHEMVHVKQYRTLGRTRFLNEYIMQNLMHGFAYCQDSFEREAYTFGANMARSWGGEYCNATVDFHNSEIDACGLGIDKFTCTTDYEVCGTGRPDCARTPTTLHRMSLSCTGGLVSDVANVDLSTYGNYRCESRFQEQCINDGSFDGYYMEWCDYSGETCKQIAPKEYACDPGATPSGSCQPTKVHRTLMNCNGNPASDEEVIDLTGGYSDFTCNNRFRSQCVQDGSWDTYSEEWCEYACD